MRPPDCQPWPPRATGSPRRGIIPGRRNAAGGLLKLNSCPRAKSAGCPDGDGGLERVDHFPPPMANRPARAAAAWAPRASSWPGRISEVRRRDKEILAERRIASRQSLNKASCWIIRLWGRQAHDRCGRRLSMGRVLGVATALFISASGRGSAFQTVAFLKHGGVKASRLFTS